MLIFLTWIHMLAAFVWIGGMLFLTLALVPVLKREAFAAQCGQLFQAVGLRFRFLVWTAVLVLLTTGPVLLVLRGDSLADPAGWPLVLKAKLLLVALLIALSAAHDFWLGPKAAALRRGALAPESPLAAALVRFSPWLGRAALVVSLLVLLLAVTLART
ncbi:DUF4149 domain-containing protein [Nitrospira sp. Kam-Ns4a]